MFDILFLQVSFIKWLQWWAMDTTAIRSMSTPVKEISYKLSLSYSKVLLSLQLISRYCLIIHSYSTIPYSFAAKLTQTVTDVISKQFWEE